MTDNVTETWREFSRIQERKVGKVKRGCLPATGPIVRVAVQSKPTARKLSNGVSEVPLTKEQPGNYESEQDRQNPASRPLEIAEPTPASGLSDRLVELMARLRGPQGCPWDRAQDYDSMKAMLLEEAYEVVDAVNARDFAGLEEELGDLLFQVVFYSRLAEEEGRFTLANVMERLYSKLVRRHPHVFGEKKARTPEEALKSWNAVKEQERHKARLDGEGRVPPAGASNESERESLLDGIAATLPSTLEAHELGVRAAEVGFDWPGA